MNIAAKTNAKMKPKPVTLGEFRQMYAHPESFCDLLPWREYDADHQCFVLEDGESVGAFYDITAVGSEARPAEWLKSLRDNLQNVLNAIPECSSSEGHWVVQFFLQDEPSLDHYMQNMRDYVAPRARGTVFTEQYLAQMESHLKTVCRPGGLFIDNATSGSEWRGKVRRVRATLFRRRKNKKLNREEMSPIAELNEAGSRFVNALNACGVGARRGNGRDLYRWMLCWFNPGMLIDDLMTMAPYPGDTDDNAESPFGFDFAERLLLNRPQSDKATGTWWFDERPHQALTVQNLRAVPKIGHITAERAMGDHTYAFFDKVPEGTVLAMTITIKPKDEVLEHLGKIQKAAKGESAEVDVARKEIERAMREIAEGNSLYPTELVWYVRGDDIEKLRYQVSVLKAKLISNDLQVIDERGDPLSLDTYIRNLPMNYDPALDNSPWTRRRRSRLWYARQIANLLPLYGRSTGTGHPGFAMFTRSAEPLTFDPLHKKDRKKNAHMVILGPTGAGKSATLTYEFNHLMAIHRPRKFIIEAGNSFGLFGEHCRQNGLTVNHVSLHPDADVSLPPFADAMRLLDAVVDPEKNLDEDDDTKPSTKDDDEKRDILGEMEISARIMITGGEEKEDARMTRADRFVIRKAILNAAQASHDEGRDYVITSDVANAMRRLAEAENGPRRERIIEMADGLDLFCSGIAGKFFNRPGKRWPDADVTIVDMGMLAREGYQDLLTVAFVGLMNAINDLVEREQHQDRPTVVTVDEAHIITTNPLLAPFVVKITKMWRKLGTWLWLATQNLEDFPNASRKMLNMMEWWLCLVMPKDEIDQIARFRSLTAEQRTLLEAPRKDPGKYTEGVVLSDQLKALFRVVTPPLALALAMTEKEEKAERGQIMQERGCTGLEAAYVVAERIGKSRE